MRAFIAVNLERHIQAEIEQMQRDMGYNTRGVRWVNRELLHITLKFLGDIDQSTVSNISMAMDDIKLNHASVMLSFGGLGAFPTLKKPRIIWIGLEKGASELTSLALDIDKAMKEIQGTREIGTEPNKKGRKDIFKPHLTIGRAKKNETAHISQDVLSGKWHCTGAQSVNCYFLMESKLTYSGPIYKPVRKFLLK